MSRTDKTRPLSVRMMDPKDVAAGVSESHSHEKGYCDLPARNYKAMMERYEAMAAGTYPIPARESCAFHFSYKGVNICGCPMCTVKDARREERRKIRHQSKKVLGNTRKMAQSVLDENDEEFDDALDSIDSVIPAHMQVSYY